MKLNKLLILLLILCLSACKGYSDPIQAFESGNYEISYKLFRPLAEQGDLEAQNYLGVQYYLGLGVAKDYKKAVEWYEVAAKKGHADAQRNLGDMYLNGHGVNQDEFKAYVWYFASSQQGNESAKPRLDVLASDNNLSPNLQMHAKIEANQYILDPNKRFMSHDTYIDKNKKL